jgi:D-xylose transport system substrate-binding protein
LRITNKRAVVALLAATGIAVTACGSSSKTSTPTTAAPATTAAPSSATTAAPSSATTAAPSSATTTAPVASTSASSFGNTFSAMTALTSLTAAGKGKVGVILPDTTSSARYVEFDAPYLTEAFEKAGLPKSDFSIQNAEGSDATALTDAKADVTNGATVLAIDPEDPAGGIAIENYAKQQGVAVIEYDRLTLGGSGSYYISFNNVDVGKLIGNGLVSCATAWGVTKPNVIVMKGAPTDNNATLFAQGYDGVLAPLFASGKYVKAATPAGTWTPATALSEFQQAYTAHKDVNAALIPNDENGAPIISYLQTQGIKAKTFPTTGQDATLVGLQNIISGYQCGTAYKPAYLEAQAAAALALYLRAGKTPPAGLVNGTTEDTVKHIAVPSVLLTPEWVTPSNMEATIIKDKTVSAAQLCAGKFATFCKADGIS